MRMVHHAVHVLVGLMDSFELHKSNLEPPPMSCGGPDGRRFIICPVLAAMQHCVYQAKFL